MQYLPTLPGGLPFANCTSLGSSRLVWTNAYLPCQCRILPKASTDSFHMTSDFFPMHPRDDRTGKKEKGRKKGKRGEKKKKGRKDRTKCSKKIFIYQSDKTQGGMWCCAGSAGHWVCRKEEQLEALGRKRPVSTVTFNLIFNLLLCLQLVTTGINHLAGLIAISGSFILFVLMASLLPLVFGGVQFCSYFLLAVLVYQSDVVYFYAGFLRLQYSHRFQ